MDKKPSTTLGKAEEQDYKGLKVKEVAKLFGVHPETIRRWTDKGYLKCFRHPFNNYRMYRTHDIRGPNGDSEVE